MTKKLFFFMVIIVYFFQDCKKENVSNKILLGKWDGITIIDKFTTTNPSTNIQIVVFDTLLCSVNGNTISLDFKPDSLSLYYKVMSQIGSTSGTAYTVTQEKISFYANPFTTERYSGDNSKLKSSTIRFLSNDKLVLYDLDTLNPSPLSMREVWFNFNRH